MPTLYVLRHGIAVPRGTLDIPGDDRPLTPKGEKQMRQIGRGLRRLGIEPERIVSSPLIRASRTAEIAAEALRMPDRLEASEMLRDDRDAGSIADWVRTRSEDHLMIVGHNPALSSLLGLLVTGTADPPLCELRKGGIAVLTSRDEGGYKLEWIAPPRLLRRVGNA